jgi:hypothetical protein
MANAWGSTPIFINCRDRVTSLRDLVAWLDRSGHENIVMVDNDSTYGPLLDYYDTTPHQVLRLGRNVGPMAIWETGLLDGIGPDGYVITDSDVIPDEGAPPDSLARFAELLARYPEVDKVGFGLRIDDIPESCRFHSDVLAWEAKFWSEEIEPGVYRADIDTTFALYRCTVRSHTYRALRTGTPYVARHMPWYVDSAHPGDEEEYYERHAVAGMTNWSARELPGELRAQIDAIKQARSIRPPDA